MRLCLCGILQKIKRHAGRIDNPLDDGWVEGHVSLMDKEAFEIDAEEDNIKGNL